MQNVTIIVFIIFSLHIQINSLLLFTFTSLLLPPLPQPLPPYFSLVFHVSQQSIHFGVCYHGPLPNFGSLIIICFTKDVIQGGCFFFPDNQQFKLQYTLTLCLGPFVVVIFINIVNTYYPAQYIPGMTLVTLHVSTHRNFKMISHYIVLLFYTIYSLIDSYNYY